MPRPPYRGLSLGLRVVSALIAVGGLFMILSSKPLILRAFLHPPVGGGFQPAAGLAEGGGRRDAHAQRATVSRRPRPARNVAVLDALIVGLCILSITPLLSLKLLSGLYPPYLIWGRSLVRLALAAGLFYARPRESVGGEG